MVGIAIFPSLHHFLLFTPSDVSGTQVSVVNGNPPLTISPTFRTLPDIQALDAITWTIPLRNCSLELVTVSRLETSCNCISVSPSAFVLPPSCEIPVTVSLRPPRTGDGRYSFALSAELEAGAACSRLDWTFAGRRLSGLSLQAAAPSLVVQHSELTSSAGATLTIVVLAPFDTKSLSVAPGASRLQIASSHGPPSICSNHVAIPVALRLSGDAAVGRHSVPLLISANDATGGELSREAFSVTVEVASTVMLSDDRVVAIGRAPGDSFKMTIVARSIDERTFELMQISGPDGVHINPATQVGMNGNASLVLSISGRIRQRGAVTSDVTLRFRLSDGMIENIPLRVVTVGTWR